jgi:hypothetical protein
LVITRFLPDLQINQQETQYSNTTLRNKKFRAKDWVREREKKKNIRERYGEHYFIDTPYLILILMDIYFIDTGDLFMLILHVDTAPTKNTHRPRIRYNNCGLKNK